MKRSILIAALTVAALSAPAAFAQDAKPAAAKPAMGMVIASQKKEIKEFDQWLAKQKHPMAESMSKSK